MKELKFIHVTKCGGTSIENLGKKHKLRWGRFHKEYGHHHRFVPEHLIDSYDWFVVVRNPYTRIISEYYCQWGNRSKNPKNKEEFNKYVRRRIKNRCLIGYHWTEQHLYIKNIPDVHILKLENLNSDLQELFNKYNLNIDVSIDLKKTNVRKNVVNNYTKDDLDVQSIDLIKDVYKNDFILFNYSTV